MTDPSTPLTKRALMAAFGAVMLTTFLAALDQTVVATALPQIVTDLESFENLSWVVTAYMLTATVTVPLYGKLSDLYGRRRLFVVSITLFMLGSALSGAAQTMDQLIAFRALQGIGAGGLIPLSQAAVADLVPPRERGRYQGYISGVWATAAVAGPLIGGTLTDAASWRWIFYVNIPLCLIAMVVVLRTLPAPFVVRRHSIDYAGAATLSGAITCMLLAAAWGGTTYAWTSPEVLGTAAVAVVLLAAFGAIERRAAEPLVPLALFRIDTIAISSAATFVIGAVLLGVTIYVPVFTQGVLGQSATASGVVLIPLTLGWTVASIIAGQVMARTGRYRVFPIVGSSLILIGTTLLTQIGTGTSPVALSANLVIIGAGMGVMFQTYMLASQSAVDMGQIGVTTSTLHFFRSMGGTLMVAVLGTLLTHRLAAELSAHLGSAGAAVDPEKLLEGDADVPAALLEGTRTALGDALGSAFIVLVPLTVLAVFLAFRLKERPLRRRNTPPAATPGAAVPAGQGADA